METITQKELTEIVSYDEATGEFRWISPRRRKDVGKICGSIYKIGYVYMYIKGRRYLAHRLVWLYVHGYFPEELVDHVNGIRSDNRLSNLRLATAYTNCQNQLVHKSNKTGVIGVSREKRTGKFRAQIMVNYKQIRLGAFDSIEEASKAYAEGKKRHHEFKEVRH